MKTSQALLIQILFIFWGLSAGYATFLYLQDQPTSSVQVSPPKTAPVAVTARKVPLVPLTPRGMRPLTVPVDQVVGLEGFVAPRTIVDVVLTTTPPGGGEPISKVVLENVWAAATGQQIQESKSGTPIPVSVVTVIVTPEQAEKLALATEQGRIRIVVRER